MSERTLEDADAEIAELRKHLREAAGWFREYATLHRLKRTPEGLAKAHVNQVRADLLERVAR